eukprot:3177833-Pleurochrysis_carterae.AAC.2
MPNPVLRPERQEQGDRQLIARPRQLLRLECEPFSERAGQRAHEARGSIRRAFRSPVTDRGHAYPFI